MGRPNLPTTDTTVIVDILRRLEVLENETARRRRGGVRERAIFSLAGPLYASTSGKHRVEDGGALIAVVADLNIAGTTSTVLRISKNGVVLGDLTVPAGDLYASTYLGNVSVAADVDFLQVDLVTPGTGADTVAVQIRTRT